MTPMVVFLVLLLADTDGASTTTGGLGVLTADTETPVVTETTVGADLLQALEILTDLAVEGVGDDLGVLAIGDVALSVEEPGGDLVLGGGLEDGDDTLELFGGEFTSAVKRYQSQLDVLVCIPYPFRVSVFSWPFSPPLIMSVRPTRLLPPICSKPSRKVV